MDIAILFDDLLTPFLKSERSSQNRDNRTATP
jgi:hypothetical protein